jgi:hypothetical protein
MFLGNSKLAQDIARTNQALRDHMAEEEKKYDDIKDKFNDVHGKIENHDKRLFWIVLGVVFSIGLLITSHPALLHVLGFIKLGI